MTTNRSAGPVLDPSPGRALRSARAVLFGLVCLVLATVGHALAGGCPGSVAARGIGLAGAVATGLLLGRTENDLVALLSRLAGCELGLHLLFVLLPDRSAAHGLPPADAGPAALMLAGHLAAVLATACWLRRGEAALWALVRVTARRVRIRMAPPSALPVSLPDVRRPARPAGPVPPPARPALALLPVRRGPPAVCC
jgi:hypothetical protein